MSKVFHDSATTIRAALPALLLAAILIPATAFALGSPQSSLREDPLGDETGPAPAAPRPCSMKPGQVTTGRLLFRCRSGLFEPAPTVDMEVEFRITGPIARTRVSQSFFNDTGEWLEAVYVFPLPDSAAVDRMRMMVGDRIVEGRIQEREQAKKTYARAKRQGRKASLLEQERPNIFTTSLANIGPGESIQVEIEYQEDLRYDRGRFSLRFPMVVAPRFVPGSTLIDGFAGDGGRPNAPKVSAAERITPAVLDPAESPTEGPTVSIELELEAGFPLAELHSPSHQITVDNPAAGLVRIEPREGPVPADRDFVLEWSPSPGREPKAALFRQSWEGDEYALLMLMPPQSDEALDLEREVIFVIDTSGSMGGTSIDEAREALILALGNLESADLFNIIQFNSTTQKLFSHSRAADPSALLEATRYVENLIAQGGTVMLPALEAALSEPDREERVRQIVFITDGAVGNERQLFQLIRNKLGSTRLFTVGIGSAPNAHFMRKAADFGRGAFTFISNPEQVREKMGRLLTKLSQPVLTDLHIEWGDPSAEAWPNRLPDLYAGEPLVISARLPVLDGTPVTVSGRVGSRPWDARLTLRGGKEETGVHKLWARRKIAGLMDGIVEGLSPDQIRLNVIDVALDHHLVSRYTSLVAVDVTPTAPPGVEAATRGVPVRLPAGSEYEMIFGSMPRTATAGPLYLLLGSALLGLAALSIWLGLKGMRL